MKNVNKALDGLDLTRVNVNVISTLQEDTRAKALRNLYYEAAKNQGKELSKREIAQWMWRNADELALTPKERAKVFDVAFRPS